MLKKFAQCLGLASLLLLENYMDFLAGGGVARMHVPFPVQGIVLANVADILLLTGALFVVLAPLSLSRVYPVVRLLLAIGIPLYFLGRVKSLLPFGLPHWFAPLVWLLWPVGMLFLFLKFRLRYRQAMVFASMFSSGFCVFAVFSLAQLLMLLAWNPAPHEKTAVWASGSQPVRRHARLVWIVFDELSYDQVFEHRATGLSLPHFDELKRESTVYTDVQPIGNHTVSILPELLGGRVVDDYRFRWSNQLDLHWAGVKGWHPVSGASSIFGDAQTAGWRTAAVGWYNPYCSIYGGAIDDCYWTNLDMIEGPMAQDQSLLRNTVTPLKELGLRFAGTSRADHYKCNYDVTQRLKTHLDLEQHALQAVKDDQDDLLFLHLGIPHSPNIWSRAKGAYTSECGGSYLDSLALTDVELGKVLELLKASPRWAETTVIVEGDHSWRTPLWDGLSAWTHEDAVASRGVFDTRPAVLVHRAGQSVPVADGSAWSLIRVHDVVESVLHGKG